MFTRACPPHTQTTQKTSVWVIWPKITTGKQLSKPHVYQGKTEPLCKNIKPLRENQQPQPRCGHTFSTTQPLRKFWHKIGTTMWSPCLSVLFPSNQQHTEPLLTKTMYIRVSPHKRTHITTVWAHTCTVYTESNCQGPMFIRGSPYKTTHIPQLSGHHVYKGFPI